MSRSRIASALLVACLASSGCGKTMPPVLPSSGPTPTLENLWPAVGGNRWVYGLSTRSWSDGYPSWDDPGAVPPAPTVTQALALSAQWPAHPVDGADTAHYALRFEHDGARLWLRDSLVVLPSPQARGFAANAPSGFDISPRPQFLQPGRWSGIVSDGAFRQVGLDMPPWLYFREPLVDGMVFVESVTGGYPVRTSLLLGAVPVVTPYGVHANAVEYAYVLDYGVLEAPTSAGTRYHRLWDFGRVTWVPELGPVSLYERINLRVGDVQGLSNGERRLRLLDRTVTLPAALSAAAASASR